MVVVRSVRIETCTEDGRVLLQLRQERLDAVHHLDDVGARLPLDVDDDRRRVVHPGRLLHVFRAVDHLRHVRQHHRRAVVIGDDDWLVILAGQELIVGVDLISLLRPVEIALGLVDAGRLQRGAHVLQIDTVGRKRRGVRLNAHGRLLAAADADQSHARQLRNLLRQPRVRQILDLRQRNRVRRQRQRQNRRVRRIGLAVNRRSGQIRRADRSARR